MLLQGNAAVGIGFGGGDHAVEIDLQRGVEIVVLGGDERIALEALERGAADARHGCAAAEKAASNAVQIHGAYGFSSEYNVERFYRNAKGAQIYEGTREIHTLLQADYALGFRTDKPLTCTLPIPE